MKFLVDELPYYGEDCPLMTFCIDRTNCIDCPRHWDRWTVNSSSNPHECIYLKEGELKK